MRRSSEGPEYGYLRQDENGNWLLVPEDEIDEHDKLARDVLECRVGTEKWYALVNKYDELYYQNCRIDRYHHLRVLIE